MSKALLSLGSNLGDREENLRAALAALSLVPRTGVVSCSSYYETPPFDVPDEQQDYLNAVAVLETTLSPRALLGACLGIEAAMGRQRTGYHSARVLDLDLLVFEGAVSNDPELRLPHPGLLKRAFVLVPLSELFPEGEVLSIAFGGALSKLDCSGIHRVK